MGIPATGKKIEVQAMAVHRVAGDKLADTWGKLDVMGMLMQLGVIPRRNNRAGLMLTGSCLNRL